MKRLLQLCFVFVTGCAHHVYVKPGATSQDWNRDNNDCLVKANQAGYRGGDIGSNIARNNFMDQCLSGQGWQRQTQEANAQQAAAIQKVQQDYKAKMDEFGQRKKDICAKDAYKEILAKTPCNAAEVTLEQMADEGKISKHAKPILLKFRSEMSAVDKETGSYIQTSATAPSDHKWADYMESAFAEVESYNLELYRGKITWGEYNKRRKDQATKIQAEWRNISHPGT